MPRLTKAKIAIPALVVLLAAGAGADQIWSQHVARTQLDATLANLPAGSHSHYDMMSYNAFTRTVRIGGLAITRDGHPSLSIQEVVLHHLGGSGTVAAPFQASSVRLVGTRIWRGGRSLTAALVQGQNIAVLAPGVPPPLGTPRWLIAPGSGTLLAAGSMTAADVADDEGATVGAVSIADYVDGHLRQASASNFADTHGNRIASVEAQSLDLGGLDAVFDTGRYDAAEPGWSALRPLVGHAEVVGIQSQDNGMSATVESVTLDHFAGRPFAAAPNTRYVKTTAFLLDAATALSIGGATVAGLHFKDDRTKSTGGLGALSVSGYADGALAQLSFDGLAVTGASHSQVAVGHFELITLNATQLLHAAPGASTESLIAAAGAGGVRLAALALEHVSVTPANGHTVTLASLEQTTTGSAPMQFNLKLRGLSIPAQSNPELAQGLGAIGIDPLVLDLDETGAYDKAAGTAVCNPLVLTAHGLGSLSLSAQFTHVPGDLVHQGSPLVALGGMGIGPFVLRFTNDGLVQRVIAMEAKQAGKTPQEVTDEAKLAGSFGAAGLVPDQPDAGAQVAAFVADPRNLTLTAKPAAPIPFGAFLGTGPDYPKAEAEAAKAALNLRLMAN